MLAFCFVTDLSWIFTEKRKYASSNHSIQFATNSLLSLYPIDLRYSVILFKEYKFERECGGNVYHYGTHQRMWYYGTDLMKKLEKKWVGDKYPKIYKTTQGSYNRKELYDIYKDCFVGVRLTEHDNMAMSVIEMGLMGRYSIFNGDVPCAVPYPCPPYDRYEPLTRRQWVWQDESLLGVVGKMIMNMVRAPDRLLAEEMRDFVHDDERWLDTKFYES